MFSLITGASRGIGESFARVLASEGHSLILVARDLIALNALKESLMAEWGVMIKIISIDLRDPNAARMIFERTQQEGWDVDFLINNAGFGRFGEFESHPVDDYLEMIQVNVTAPMALSHYFLGPMKARGQGAIIHVASMAAFQPTPYMTVYGATKAFLRAFSEGLTGENQASGIQVVAVCPGLTDTHFFVAAGTEVEMTLHGAPGMLTPDVVVKGSLEAVRRGTMTVVPGIKNRLMAMLSSAIPHRIGVPLAARILGRQFHRFKE
jgi:hypothetical protein